MSCTEGLTFPEYAAIPAVNWSTLKEMSKSPAHYRHRAEHPRLDSSRLAFGRAVHTAVLEPDRFPLEYVVFDGARRAGKAWDEFEAANSDRTILKAAEYATCLAVRDAVHAHPAASRMLGGPSEITLQWMDPDTGLACKARLDKAYGGCVVDLKSTSTVDAHDFERTSANLIYHGQLAFYMRGLAACGLSEPQCLPRIIAVEVEPPYDVAVFRLTADALRIGDGLVGEYLFRLSECQSRDEWPGRYDAEQDLTLPPWLMDDGTDSGLGFTVGGEKA